MKLRIGFYSIKRLKYSTLLFYFFFLFAAPPAVANCILLLPLLLLLLERMAHVKECGEEEEEFNFLGDIQAMLAFAMLFFNVCSLPLLSMLTLLRGAAAEHMMSDQNRNRKESSQPLHWREIWSFYAALALFKEGEILIVDE